MEEVLPDEVPEPLDEPEVPDEVPDPLVLVPLLPLVLVLLVLPEVLVDEPLVPLLVEPLEPVLCELPELVPLELVLPLEPVVAPEELLGEVPLVSAVELSGSPDVPAIEVVVALLSAVEDEPLFWSVDAGTSGPPTPPLDFAVRWWRRVTATGTRSCASAAVALVWTRPDAAGAVEAAGATSGWRRLVAR